MLLHLALLLSTLHLRSVASSASEPAQSPSSPIYHNQFAVYLPHVSSESEASELASRHGFVSLGQIGALEHFYLFEHARVHKRSASRDGKKEKELQTAN